MASVPFLTFSVAALPASTTFRRTIVAKPGQHTRPVRARSASAVRMSSTGPLQERLLRLERALGLAVSQQRFRDAATLRDALAALRRADPSLSARDALADAIKREDFVEAAKLRDQIAALTQFFSQQTALAVRQMDYANNIYPNFNTPDDTNLLQHTRRVDRIVVLRSMPDQPGRLRVATVSRDGALELPLEPPPSSPGELRASTSALSPRIYLQPCFSPSGDFVCMTEIAFKVIATEGNTRVVSLSDSTHRVCVMNAFDGTIVKSVPVRKPPFFYYWSPCGTRVSMLYNGATSDSALPTVSLSVLQVVAPASGSPPTILSNEPDAIAGPVVSGHPLFYEFCPRDSNKVVAHVGDRSEVVVSSLRLGDQNVVLSRNAGTFGTPQWHPLSGKSGREVVLFVEAEVKTKKDSKVLSGPIQPQILKVQGLSNRTRTPPEIVIREHDTVPIDDDADTSSDSKISDETDEKVVPEEPGVAEKSSDFWNTLSVKYPSGSATNFLKILEDLVKRGAESLGGLLADQPIAQKNALADVSKPPSESLNLKKDNSVDADSKLEKVSEDADVENKTWGDSKKTASKLCMVDVNNPKLRRDICRCKGTVSFKLSPDGERLALLATNSETGEEELSIISDDFSPDSVVDPVGGSFTSSSGTRSENSSTLRSLIPDVRLSTPESKVIAFFWSPDATKLLFLSSLRNKVSGAARWSTFDTRSNRVTRYEPFVLSAMAAHGMSFFCSFANSMTPWSPDSDAFCYAGRALTPEEESIDLDEAAGKQANAATLLTALMLQKKRMIESSKGLGFSAYVQEIPQEDVSGAGSSRSKPVPPPAPKVVLENVELVAWSQC